MNSPLPGLRSPDAAQPLRNAFTVRDLAALALMAALVLLFFWRILTPRLEDRAIFPPGDFSDQFWAFRMYEARAFAQGRLPLWSENFNSGHPFLADVQSAIFYPVSLVWTLAVVAFRGGNFTLFDLELEAIFHFFLAGAFTYLFARRLIGSRGAGLVAAVTFTFGGYLTSYPPQQLAILETATWLPLALLFLDRAVSQADRAAYIYAGIVLGIDALAGHPQTFLFVAYACIIYFIWRIWQCGITSDVSSIRFYASRSALVLLIAAGLAAAQWIPGLEYQSVSTRAAINWAEAARGFPTLDPLQMILPGFASAFQSPLYVGVFPLWLAIVALLARQRERAFWVGLALGALVVSFGAYVFAYAVLYLFVPGFGMFRDQERLAFVVSFALALLAGYGIRDVLSAPERARRAFPLLPAGVTVGVVMLLTMYIAAKANPTGRLFFLGDRAGLMVLLFVLTTGIAAVLISSRAWPGRAEWALSLALIVFDLFSINSAAYNAGPTPRYPETQMMAAIKRDPGVFRVADEGQMPGHFGIGYDLEEIGGISPLRIAHYNDLLDALPPEKLFPLLNVRYLITARPGFAQAEVVLSDGDTRLLRLNNGMPRAWFVPFAVQNSNDGQVLAAMTRDAFDPWQVAYLADESPFPLPSPPISGTQAKAARAGEFHRTDPEHVEIILNAPADGLVLLSQPSFPGWSATVDGMPTPILRADVALTALPVHAGAQRVQMVYDPWSVKIGIGITLVTLLATAGIWGIWQLRR